MQQGRPPLPTSAPPPQAGGASTQAPQQQQQPQTAQLRQGNRPARVDYETVFTNAKAGMEGVDPEHVKRVVYEASKDSPHYANEQRKDTAVEQKIARMQAQAHALTVAELAAHTASMDARLAELEGQRDLTRTWLHVDMDAFFAAVEELEQPALRGRPFAVGSIGMISTASYAARKFGVRSAMPGFIALKLCPHLIFVAPSFDKYRRASEATRAVFRCYDPDFQPGSLDEASLDVTDYCAAHNVSGEVVAAEIRRRVQQETHLTCSVGIAPNRMLSKICSDKNKPNGQFALEATRDAVLAFMAPLSIRNVPGVGKVTQKVLARFGVHTGADLLKRRGLLEALFTPTSVDWFARVALGLGETRHSALPAEGEVGRKGISHERTFRPLSRRADLEAKLRELAEALAADMAEEGGLRGKTVTLKLKASTFELHTRATTLPSYLHTAEELYAVGLRLLRAEMPCELRLLGLRVSNFKEEGKRERGQRSIQEMLRPRQQQQEQEHQSQQQEGQQAGMAAATEADVIASGSDEEADGDGQHTSQVLCAGELLELSLRDWHPQPAGGRQEEEEEALSLSLRDWQQPAAGGSSDNHASAAAAATADEGWSTQEDPSLQPSLAVSPASATRYGQQAMAAAAATEMGSSGLGSGGPRAARRAAGLPLHMPPTGLDVMLHQAAEKLARQEDAGGQLELQGAQPQAQQQQQQQEAQTGPAAEHASQHQLQQQEAQEAPVVDDAGQQLQQEAQPVWACSACTFENSKSSFWCVMCGTSRIPRREQPAPAATAARAVGKTQAGSSKATANSSKPGKGGAQAGSSGKGKRGRKPAAQPSPGLSILRFMSGTRQASLPSEQHQKQQKQQGAVAARQASSAVDHKKQVTSAATLSVLPAGEQQQQQEAAESDHQASRFAQQQRHLLPAAQQQQQQQPPQPPPPQHAQQLPPDGQEAQHLQQAQAAPAEQQQGCEAWEDIWGSDADFWSSQDLADMEEPESPPGPFEDILECNECGRWLKETRFQAHQDMHLAHRLQAEEEKMERLYERLVPAGSGGGRGSGSGSKPAGGSSKKRGTTNKGGQGGGRQATLQATLAKRARQQQ